MTLTKQDLTAIGHLIDTKLESKLEEKLDSKLKPIHDDIKTIKKDVRKLRKDLDGTIKFFDHKNLESELHLEDL